MENDYKMLQKLNYPKIRLVIIAYRIALTKGECNEKKDHQHHVFDRFDDVVKSCSRPSTWGGVSHAEHCGVRSGV